MAASGQIPMAANTKRSGSDEPTQAPSRLRQRPGRSGVDGDLVGGGSWIGPDAIHVASALIGGAEEFVTYDDRQAEAARTVGLRAVSPGRS
jgi:hypothetical protein